MIVHRRDASDRATVFPPGASEERFVDFAAVRVSAADTRTIGRTVLSALIEKEFFTWHDCC